MKQPTFPAIVAQDIELARAKRKAALRALIIKNQEQRRERE